MNKIQQAFNRAAATYDHHCQVQHHAGMKLTNLLKLHHPQASQLLDLGCGTGLNTEFLASQYEYQDFHALDISSALLTQAKTKLDTSGIKIYEMSFDKLSEINQGFDIIYSNMSLQWSMDLFSCLANISTLLHENGSLAFSLPLPGTFRELEKYCAINHFENDETICTHLKHCGYDLLAAEKESITLSFPDAISALQSIKQIGANHVRQRSHKGLKAKSWLSTMPFSELTYEIAYYIARQRPSKSIYKSLA